MKLIYRVVNKELAEDTSMRLRINGVKNIRFLTGSASKGNGSHYFYYHCRSGCKERFRAMEANATFSGHLTAISNKEKLFRSFELILKDANKKSGKEKTIGQC